METVRNLPDLIDLIERRSLNSKQICKILEDGFKIFAEDNKTPETLLEEIQVYWDNFRFSKSKPIFLDQSFDYKQYLKEELIPSKRTDFGDDYKSRRAAKIASILNNNGEGYHEDNSHYGLFIMGKEVMRFE